MSRQFEKDLMVVLGLGHRKIIDLVLTCKTGEVTTVQCTELIIGERSVDRIARTFDLVERDVYVGLDLASKEDISAKVGKSLTCSLMK